MSSSFLLTMLVVGLRAIHQTSWFRATAAAVLPSLVGYWVGYRVLAALRTLASF